MSEVVDLPVHQARSRVMIVSADRHLVTNLVDMLSATFTVMADCDNLKDVPAAVRRSQPHITLLDARLPGGLLAAISDVTVNDLGQVLLIGSERLEFERLRHALRAGASGYVIVDPVMARMPAIIAGVLCGEAALPRAVVGDLLAEFRARPAQVVSISPRKRVRLTQREREVLMLLRSGHNTVQIGRKLGVATVTVRSHVSRLMRKLNARDRDDLRTLHLPGLDRPAERPGRPIPSPARPEGHAHSERAVATR